MSLSADEAPTSSVDESEDSDVEMDDVHKDALMKIMLADPGLFREYLDANPDNEPNPSDNIDPNHKLSYLQIFCDWKQHIVLLLDNDNNENALHNLNTNPSTESDETSFASTLLSEVSFNDVSPYVLLDLLLVERNIKQRKNNINQQSIDTLIKNGAYELKGYLYKRHLRYFDAHFEAMYEPNSEQYLCQKKLSESVQLSLTFYHQVVTQLNIKNNVNDTIFNKSYSVFHLMQKIQQKKEYNQLLSVMEQMQGLESIPAAVINCIAQYSCTIYAKCTNSGAVHFVYCAIMPNKEIYEGLWYVKDKETFNTDYFEQVDEFGEIVHVFEPCHCDPRFTAEGRFNGIDIVLYYESIDIYCIVGYEGIKTVDFEMPSYLLSDITETK